MKVVLLQRVLPHYRIPFFIELQKQLELAGIDFKLIVGQEYPGQVPKSYELDKPWVERIHNFYFSLFGIEIVLQPLKKEILKDKSFEKYLKKEAKGQAKCYLGEDYKNRLDAAIKRFSKK